MDGESRRGNNGSASCGVVVCCSWPQKDSVCVCVEVKGAAIGAWNSGKFWAKQTAYRTQPAGGRGEERLKERSQSEDRMDFESGCKRERDSGKVVRL